MNQDQQPQPWWKDKRLVWVLAALFLIWLLTITILFPFPLTTIPFLSSWQSWDWRWLVLLGLIFLSAGVLYLTMRRLWNRLFDLTGLRGKTLWDFIGLLIVPLVIALAGWWLSEVSTRNQQQIEDDRVRQTVLQSYIQAMTELLLDKGLATSEPDKPIRDIARSSTLAAVRQLDVERKGILLEFLSESNLVIRSSIGPIISLSGADLSGVNLGLGNLSGAILSRADLRDARLYSANLSRADLSGANVIGADLSNANLSFANLSFASLADANLSLADLSGANLSFAYLSGANVIGADLSGADLINANLSDAKEWTNEQLAQAESLVGATLPDGTVMTEEGWEEFKRRYRQ